MIDYEKMAREIHIQVDVIRKGTGHTTDMQIVVLPETYKEIAQALERVDISGRIEQAFEDGQLALRIHDDPAEHCPDEVTRRITHEVIPALRKRLEEVKEGGDNEESHDKRD